MGEAGNGELSVSRPIWIRNVRGTNQRLLLAPCQTYALRRRLAAGVGYSRSHVGQRFAAGALASVAG